MFSGAVNSGRVCSSRVLCAKLGEKTGSTAKSEEEAVVDVKYDLSDLNDGSLLCSTLACLVGEGLFLPFRAVEVGADGG